MAKRKRRKPRTRRAPAPRRWRSAGWIVLIGLMTFAGYAVYLDFEIRGAFEGRRWAVPARVYARSLELFAGAPISIEQLTEELQRLEYRSVTNPQRPGEYHRAGNTLHVHTRQFRFWDAEEPARRLRIQFDGGVLRAVGPDTFGAALPIARLDPPQIGAIYPAHREDRVLIRLADVPPLLIQGLLAVEDRNFYQHSGIDLRAIARAAWANLRALSLVQGASTVTQQLVKNFFLTPERTLWRKSNEALMALLLEWHYDKDEILQAYLNEIYLGQRGRYAIHGFGLASRFYFGRPIEQLDAAQLATLIGFVRGPSYYDPWRHPQRALERRNRVLRQMAGQRLLDSAEAKRLQKQPLGIGERPAGGATPYPGFMDLVRRQLRQFYREEDLTSEGLRIFTTLDPVVQAQAERAVARWMGRLERRSNLSAGTLETALLVSARERGEVLALVGGSEPRYPGFNRVLDAARPIGSLIKPVVYLAALSEPDRYHLATRIDDSPIRIQGQNGTIWSPQNFDGEYRGAVTLRDALTNSYNVPVVRVGMDLGMERVLNSLRQLGARRSLDPYPSLFLGAAALTPLEVGQIYQSLADGGFATPLRGIREVLSADGQPLQRYPLVVEQAADPRAVFLVSSVLQQVVSVGTAKQLAEQISPNAAIAGKTGTTDGMRDSWFAGYTTDHVAVVWVGRDDNEPTGLTGSSGAMRIWGELMARLPLRPLELLPPEGIEWARVDRDSGLIANDRCERSDWLPFVRGSEPRQQAPCATPW